MGGQKEEGKEEKERAEVFFFFFFGSQVVCHDHNDEERFRLGGPKTDTRSVTRAIPSKKKGDD